MKLAWLDVAIVVLYMVGVLALGAWFSRKQTGLTTYFVGDRNVAWWLVLGSIIATETSTVTFLSVPGTAYARDLTFLQLPIGYMIGRVVIAWLLVPMYFRGEVMSAYQVLRERFDARVQRTASGLFLVTRTIADGLRLYLTALLLAVFTGWDISLSIVVIGIVTIVYTYLGGMQAVVWTDMIQLAVYLLGAVAAAVIMVHLAPGGASQLWQSAEDAGKLVVFNLEWDRTQAYTLWAGVLGGAFFTMASHGADQLMVQRYLCSRSVGEARLALVASGVAVFLQFGFFLLVGLGLYGLHQAEVLEVAKDTRNDEVFGLFIVRFLPQGLVGLVVAAVLAAAMSTLSSSLNSSAGALILDFYRPLRSGKTEAHYLTVSKIMTAVFGVAQIGVALLTHALPSDRSIVDQVLTVAGFTTGLVLGLFVLGGLRQSRWRVSSRSALVGAGVGLVAVLLVWLPLLDEKAFLAWPWYAPVGTITTVLVALVMEAISKRDRTRESQQTLD